MNANPERFDSQAAIFEERAGLSDDVAQKIAASVVEIAGAGPDDLVFEIGAGTGEIGLHLLPLTRYVGIDRSDGMLDIFRSRLESEDEARVRLVHTDADQEWPAEDGSVAAVFGSRVVHLLDQDHLSRELERVLRPGGSFLVGRVERDRDSARGRLRQRRQRALKDHGVKARQAQRITEDLLDELVASGAEPIEPTTVATWAVTISPAEILDQWSRLTSMGGATLDEESRNSILSEVRSWAEKELGDLDRPETSTEAYRVTGVRIGGTPASASV